MTRWGIEQQIKKTNSRHPADSSDHLCFANLSLVWFAGATPDMVLMVPRKTGIIAFERGLLFSRFHLVVLAVSAVPVVSRVKSNNPLSKQPPCSTLTLAVSLP